MDKIEKLGIILFSSFFVVAGGAELFVLYMSGFRLLTFGLLGSFSLVTAYGLIKKKKWAIWLAAILFFLRMTSGATTLYASIQTLHPITNVWLFYLMLIAYLAGTVIASLYVLIKRRNIE